MDSNGNSLCAVCFGPSRRKLQRLDHQFPGLPGQLHTDGHAPVPMGGSTQVASLVYVIHIHGRCLPIRIAQGLAIVDQLPLNQARNASRSWQRK